MSDRFGYGEIGLDIHPCRGCEDYESPNGCKSNGGCGKQTNADYLRAMTDEQLASFVCDRSCAYCPMDCEGRMSVGRDACYKRWLDWLKQEVDK